MSKKHFNKKYRLIAACLVSILAFSPALSIAVRAQSKTVSNVKSTTGTIVTKNGYKNGDKIGLNSKWKYSDFSVINEGKATMYTAPSNRKGKIIAVNAGHGTKDGAGKKTYSHPDKSPKITGGTNPNGAVKSMAISTGMNFKNGISEGAINLKVANKLKDMLIADGYDVLMLRENDDARLDNVARSVIANNTADIHISIHFDGDSLSSDKGVFYMSVPKGLRTMEPVASHYKEHDALGDSLIEGLKSAGLKVWGSNPLPTDLTQMSYSTIPTVDVELGNEWTNTDDESISLRAKGLLKGINLFYGYK